MECGDEDRYASAINLLSQSTRFLLEEDNAKKIIDEMEKYIRSEWYSTARSVGVSGRECEQISGAFAHPGFHSKTDEVIS